MARQTSNTSEVSSFSEFADVKEALKGKYSKFEGYDVNFVVVKSVGFLSVPTLENSKTVKFELPSHYPFVAFIGSSEGTRTQTVGKDENLELEMDAGESLFVFFNLKE